MEEIGINDMAAARLRAARHLEDNPGPLNGYLIVKLNGKIVHEGPNLVTNAGKAMVVDRIGSATPGAASALMSHMGMGDSATAPAVGNTELGNEFTLSGYTRESLGQAVDTSSRQISATVTFLAGNPGSTVTVREIGIFNAATSGNLYAHAAVPNAPVKTAQDSLEIVYTLSTT